MNDMNELESSSESNIESNIIRTNYFFILKKQNFSIINLTNIQDPEALTELKNNLLLLGPVPTHTLFNFAIISDPNQLNDDWISCLNELNGQLSSVKKKLILYYLSSDLLSKLLSNPNNNLNIVPNLIMALEELDVHLGHVDGLKYIQVLVNALLKTYYLEYKTLLKKEKIYIKKEKLNTLDGDLHGIFNVKSGASNYLLFLSFPDETANKIIASQDSKCDPADFLDLHIKKIQQQVNFILEGIESEVNLGDITIFQGKEFQDTTLIDFNESLEKGYSIIIPFQCQLGNLSINLWFKELNTAINFME
ncbi:MAG: hypothetical protein HQK49_20070 [Oligoflexia bacterium]|nr:hypothetical protein [Oligoflexia bacterium]